MKDVSGVQAVVTGGSRGLGKGIVKHLAEKGMKVLAVAKNEELLNALKDEVNGDIEVLAGDVADQETAQKVIRDYNPKLLVLNAGKTPHMAPIQEQSWEQFSEIWENDTKQVFHWLREALNQPLDPGSHVIVGSSGAAIPGSPLSGGYAGAKKMQWFIAKYYAQQSEKLERNIRFQVIFPKGLVGSTSVGNAASAAYAKASGISQEQFLQNIDNPLTPEQFGAGVFNLFVSDDKLGLTYRITNDDVDKVE